jgi:MipA family protein
MQPVATASEIRLMKRVASAFVLVVLAFSNSLRAEEQLTNRMQGDLGFLLDAEQLPLKGEGTQAYILPYAYFDYGRFFARIDTFGIKTLPLAYGHVELAGRINLDGYQSAGNTALKGINDRRNSVPIGLGTFQLTPIGGLFLYAFHDINQSHGNIYEATYAAQVTLGDVTLYPEAGFEYCTNSYTRYYYGVSVTEAVASGYAPYVPEAAFNPSLGLFADIPVAGNWHTIFYLHRKWLDTTISNSPLVAKGFVDSGFIALTFHFK